MERAQNSGMMPPGEFASKDDVKMNRSLNDIISQLLHSNLHCPIPGTCAGKMTNSNNVSKIVMMGPIVAVTRVTTMSNTLPIKCVVILT